MEGNSNPAFIDDSSNQITVIHTNPEPPNAYSDLQTVPSIIATDYDATSTPESVTVTSPSNEFGSKSILVDDVGSSKPIESRPPYNPPPYDEFGTLYEANIASKPVERIGGDNKAEPVDDENDNGRDQWGKDIEFLLSCIAMSVGLGNVWRFPFIALENGGGAFVIPYIIVLIIVGKPIYYIEMLIGQFSSRGSVKVYDLAPAMRGAGVAQVYAIAVVTTYYTFLMSVCLKYLYESFNVILPWSECASEWENCVASSQTGVSFSGNISKTSAELYFVLFSVAEIICVGLAQLVALLFITTFYSGLMAIIGHYLFDSFRSPLPWSYCRPEWDKCLDASSTEVPEGTNLTQFKTSSEFYFVRSVLREKDSIEDGLGNPNWELVVGLAISWIIIALLLIKGVRSSGKASYFLALFPYVVMIILFIRAVTLPGAMRGLEYFFKPQWDKLLSANVWYEAVTQVFFSLSVCFGNVIMYASYNKFRHNVSRDATIITTIDTFTSLLAGTTVFGILGHLAYKLDTDDVGSVVKGGPGLAFISYPDAIAKFDWAPQFFAVLFFFMLYVLGIGSNVAMTSCITTIFKDYFKGLKNWIITSIVAVIMFCVALIYTTPGGQFVLELVNLHGVTFISLAFAIMELAAFSWIYGVNRFCEDVYFMLGYRPHALWKWCWAVITPGFMIVVFLYFLATWKNVTYNGVAFSDFHYAIGWVLTALGLSQLPIWMAVAYFRQTGSFKERLIKSFRPHPRWGPTNPALNRKYKEFISAYD